MVFVMVDSCRAQLERLTQRFVSTFPGSTIYQHTDLLRVPYDVLNHKVDVLVLEAEMAKLGDLDLVQKLHRQKLELPVFIISKTNDLCEQAMEAGANGYFVMPEDEESLLEAIRLVKHKKDVS